VRGQAQHANDAAFAMAAVAAVAPGGGATARSHARGGAGRRVLVPRRKMHGPFRPSRIHLLTQIDHRSQQAVSSHGRRVQILILVHHAARAPSGDRPAVQAS
jgi:hypothetical protein